MARNGKRTEMRRFNFCVPADDGSIIAFFEAQHNQTETFKAIVREAITRYGISDIFVRPVPVPKGRQEVAAVASDAAPKAVAQQPVAEKKESPGGIQMTPDSMSEFGGLGIDGGSAEKDAALASIESMMAQG